ncbi:NosD domain-containing protein [Actinobaculum sp. 352]|uniref:NosD domain-containing protein n=1 Tax=Actinobaculum sp. 352 TaxID=2490946 RepID=UPI0019D2F0FD|nr:NosD domain-containing protein [Actinobaculum sp. 352]
MFRRMAAFLTLALMSLFSPVASSAAPNTVHVSATDGSDQDGDGSTAKPYATLAHAVTQVSDGDTIALDSGTYREGGIFVRKSVTITEEPGATAVLDGSQVVSDWRQTGNAWTTSSSDFVRFCDVCTTNNDPSREGMAAYVEQVFYDGEPLTQVASADQVTDGTFYVYDPDPVTLQQPNDVSSGYNVKPHRGTAYVIGSDPNGHTVEIVEHARAVTLVSGGIVWDGVDVQRYSPVQRWDYDDPEIGTMTGGAMFVNQSAGSTVANSTFSYSAAGTAAEITTTENVTFKGNRVVNNGGVGFGINKSKNVTAENNLWSRNNLAGFITTNCGAYCTLSDTKITHSEGVRYASNTHDYSDVGYDHSDPEVESPYRLNGVWFDEGVVDSSIVNNSFINVGRTAIYDEVSSHNIIASNVVASSHEGIVISGSDHDQIWNNTVVDTVSPLIVREDTRYGGCNARAADGSCTAPEPWSRSRGLSWNTTNTSIYNNVFGQSSSRLARDPYRYSVIARFSAGTNGDGTRIGANEMVEGMDHNTYFRTSAEQPSYVIHWKTDEEQPGFNASTLADFTGSSTVTVPNAEVNGQDVVASRGSQDLFTELSDNAKNTGKNNLRARPGGRLDGTGTALPKDVATAIGEESDTPVNRGALVSVTWGAGGQAQANNASKTASSTGNTVGAQASSAAPDATATPDPSDAGSTTRGAGATAADNPGHAADSASAKGTAGRAVSLASLPTARVLAASALIGALFGSVLGVGVVRYRSGLRMRR